MGAVSNWVWNLPELLHALDLVRHFDFIAASARIGFEKPHPRIFEWALEQAGSSRARRSTSATTSTPTSRGARGVGIEPVLIDRAGRYPADACPRACR